MLDALLDLVHGAGCLGCARPGRVLCPRCRDSLPQGGHEVRPTPCPDGLTRCFAAAEYADPLRTLILHHKEHRGFSLSSPLGAVLAGVIDSLQRAGPDPLENAELLVLVPVPSRRSVVRDRGHDPMLRITRAAAGHLRGAGGPEIRVSSLLRHRGPVADQSGLDTAGRSANLDGRMMVRAAHLAALVRVARPSIAVVCDDVITTGATAREGQRALADAGIAVLGVACIAATRKRWQQSLPLSQDGG